jgi:hypothetical protein
MGRAPSAASTPAGSRDRRRGGRHPSLRSGEADLLPLQGGVPERGDGDELVAVPLGGLAELTRAPGTTPAAAIRGFVLDSVEGIRRIPAGQWRGELGFLAAISPTVHRLALEMSDRQAATLAAILAETDTLAPEIARLRGIALAGVFQIIIAEAGRRTREGQSQDQIADELRPAIEAVLDDLDAWLTPRYGPGQQEPRDGGSVQQHYQP